MDLDAFVVEWNTHPLGPNPNVAIDSPPGRPDDLTLFNIRNRRSTNAH